MKDGLFHAESNKFIELCKLRDDQAVSYTFRGGITALCLQPYSDCVATPRNSRKSSCLIVQCHVNAKIRYYSFNWFCTVFHSKLSCLINIITIVGH